MQVHYNLQTALTAPSSRENLAPVRNGTISGKEGVVFKIFLGFGAGLMALLGAGLMLLLTDGHLTSAPESPEFFIVLNAEDFANADLDKDQLLSLHEMTAYAETAYQAFFSPAAQDGGAAWEEMGGTKDATEDEKREWLRQELWRALKNADEQGIGNWDGKASFAEMQRTKSAEVEHTDEWSDGSEPFRRSAVPSSSSQEGRAAAVGSAKEDEKEEEEQTFQLNKQDFAEADLNEDGTLSKAELVIYSSTVYKAFFQDVDEAALQEDFPDLPKGEAAIREWVKQELWKSLDSADRNGNRDGKASFEEMEKVGFTEKAGDAAGEPDQKGSDPARLRETLLAAAGVLDSAPGALQSQVSSGKGRGGGN